MRKNFKRTALAALVLTVMTMAALPAAAREDDECLKRCRNRKGWLVGGNAGWGGAIYSSHRGNRTITEDAIHGGYGALRAGYAFSNSFALTLEGVGFGSYDDEDEWGVGAGLVTVTWWPDASGFFLRMGFGGGGGDLAIRGVEEKIHFEDKGAGYFGVGYEWQLGRKFALGLAADAYGFDLEGVSGVEEDFAGVSAVSIQFNWYL